MKQCHFNKIIIIQSLDEADFHTGNKILEDIDLYNVVHDRGLKIELVNVTCKEDLISIFKQLIDEAKTKQIIPIVHIESHGSSETDGLILSSKVFISWEELKELLIELNTATQLNLLLVFAACYGAYFSEKLVPSDRAPCWGVIGPKKTVTSGNLVESFSSFYQEILDSGSGGRAVKKLNQNSLKGGGDYFFTTAEIFFIHTYKHYIEELCCDDEYGKRAKKNKKRIDITEKRSFAIRCRDTDVF